MNESEVPAPKVSLPVAVGSRSPTRCIVTLPQTDLVLCVHLAQQIADAVVPEQVESRGNYSSRRATWSEIIITGASAYPPNVTDSLLPGSQPAIANLEEGSPQLTRWLQELERRWRDLQEWVDRGEISIFGSYRIKYRHVSYDTYLKRQDAVRYCQESGFDVVVGQATTHDAGGAVQALETTACSISARPQQATTSLRDADAAPRQAGTTQKDTSASAPVGSILRPKAAMARTGLPRSTFYERQNPKSRYFDPTFPQARSLGEGAVGYLEAEVDQWIAARPSARP